MNIVAIDTETDLISTGNLAPELACMSMSDPAGNAICDAATARSNLEYYLDDNFLIVGHNIAYDMAVLMRAHPSLGPAIWRAYCEDRITDTMLREQLIHIAGGVYRGYETAEGDFRGVEYTLEALAKRHLGKQLDKNTWRLQYGELRHLPLESWPEGARKYPVDDAVTTLEIYQKQEANAEYLNDQFRQARAAFWLHLCSVHGITTDQHAVDALEVLWKEDFEQIKAYLLGGGLIRPDGSRNTKAAKALMEKVFPDCPRTATGDVSLAHQACTDSGNEQLIKYAEYSGYSKKFSTDLPMLRKGLVQCRYRALVESGRTSSEKPNIQNLPRKPGVRECFVPRVGHVFAVCDYNGFELHTWAQACIDLLGRSRMADALNAGRDPHADVAAVLGFQPGSDGFKDARQVGKVANFGFPGGLGKDRFRDFALSGYGLHIDETTAAQVREAWFAAWPEATEYFALVSKLVDGSGTIRQLRSDRYRGGVTFCQACNSFFQGLAADAAKAAGWEITRRCYGEVPGSMLLGSRIVAFVHDEFILEVPEEVGHEAAMELSEVMVSVANQWTPDVANRAEALLARRWSKLAKPIHENGRLVPWDL